MSDDAILQALDRMITGFKRDGRTSGHGGHPKTQVATEKSNVSAPMATVATVATKNQSPILPEGDPARDQQQESSPNYFLDSRESSIEFSTGGNGGHGGYRRGNPEFFRGHLKTEVATGGHSRTNPRFFVDPEAFFACFWHIEHGEKVAPGLCAGCRAPIGDGVEALDIADGNRVHFDPDCRCLIAWGAQWRSIARAALARKPATVARGMA